MISHFASQHNLTRLRTFARTGWAPALMVLCGSTTAQQQDRPVEQLPAVSVSAKPNPNPVEKSYRKMLKGVDLFARQHGQSPNAELRFKLLPCKRGTDMQAITLAVVGDTVDYLLPIAVDHTFSLPRNALALQEDAQVIPNRRALSMTWRTDIRTPGLPPDTRRLGDLRLECKVGMEASLISNSSSLLGRLTSAALDTPAYCDKTAPLYLFFADRPLFSVTLVSGQRREALAVDNLYAAASYDTSMRDNLPYCDCEALVDRTYVLPLGDRFATPLCRCKTRRTPLWRDGPPKPKRWLPWDQQPR